MFNLILFNVFKYLQVASGCRTGQQRSSIRSSLLWGRTPAAGVSVGVGREQVDTERSSPFVHCIYGLKI